MQMPALPFRTTDCSSLESTDHRGERGVADWRTRTFGARPFIVD